MTESRDGLAQMTFVARGRKGEFGVCSIAPQPDGTVRVFLPELRGAGAEFLADELLAAAVSQAKRSQGCFCQVILPESAQEDATTILLLKRHRFKFLTQAVFFEYVALNQPHQFEAASNGRVISRIPLKPQPNAQWDARFIATLDATYVDSSDAPEVHAHRTAERAFRGLFQGDASASGWMYCVDGTPAGLWMTVASSEESPLHNPSSEFEPPTDTDPPATTERELLYSAPKQVSIYDSRVRLRINLDQPPKFVVVIQ